MKSTLSLWAILLPTLFAAAQEPWSLEQCIRYGLEHNIDLQQQTLEADIRQAAYRQARFDHLPRISAGIAQEYNWGRSVDMQELVIIRNKLSRNTGASVQTSLNLFDGLARHHGARAAGKAAEAARENTRQARDALVTDITRAYLQLMLAGQIETCAQESYAAIVQQQERTARLVEAGSHPKSALDEIAAQVAAEKAAVVEAECQVRTATLALTQLMQLPDSMAFRVDDRFGQESVAGRVTPVSDTQIEDYLFGDPRIRSAQAVHEQMRHLQRQARSALLPVLQLQAGYGSYYSSTGEGKFGTQMDENRNPSLSLHLEIPIFQAMQAGTELRKKRLSLEMARLSIEKTRSEVVDEIRSATIEAENCCQQFHSSEETLRAMQQLLEITEARYNLGAATALDYITARNNHFKALSDCLQAKWQYLFQLKLLERYRK